MSTGTAPRRILMTADAIGGIWTYALDLARSLAASDIEIALAVMGQPLSEHQWRQAQAIGNVAVHESTFRLEWMESPWEDVTDAGRWLLRLRDRLKPDLVHLNGYAHGVLPFSVPTVVVGHSCVFSWWKAVHGEWPPAAWNRYRTEVRSGLRNATHVVAPSLAMMRSLESIYGGFSNRSVIPNGRLLAPPDNPRKLPMILAAGRLWDRAKNVSALTKVASQLPWPVYLAGEEYLKQPMSEAAVHYVGHLSSEHLAEWMAKAAIFASPACYEPFGLAILEAGLSQCALVLGDIDSLRENWDGAAVFVEPHNDDQLRHALRTLIDDPSYRAEMSLRAKHRAQQFTPERMAGEYLNLYRTLCGSYSSTTR